MTPKTNLVKTTLLRNVPKALLRSLTALCTAVLVMANLFTSLAVAQDAIGQNMASISVQVTDANGAPVKDVVLTLTPTFPLETPPTRPEKPAIMNQIDKQFAPHVLVVRSGTDISFPNADNLFHHVYSFSPAKQFELKLYKEFTADPLRFEQAGIVDIGCNIHDWMLGYIVVSDSPFYGKTNDEGTLDITLPVGEYDIMTWHPQLPELQLFDSASLNVTAAEKYEFKIDSVLSSDDFDEGFGDY